MTDLEIKLAMLNSVTRERIKELAITDGDDYLMLCIDFGDNTASKIAKRTGTSVQSVSGRLRILRSKGYLVRARVLQKSGGYEYEYRSIFTRGVE